MKLTCPSHSCFNRTHFQKDGFYFRKSDSKKIQRYRCSLCGKRTSTAQLSDCYGQKKRRLNPLIEALFCSKVSSRRIAVILNIDKKTVHRKLIFLGKKARKFNFHFLEKNFQTKSESIQFDDLITKEKTKMKPVTISVVVDTKSRTILSLIAKQIPANGHLAKLSRRKYGKRESFHKEGLEETFLKISRYVHPKAIIKSDEHPFYPGFVRKYFPHSHYTRYKGRKGAVVGQGELKKTMNDPLFVLNHTCAMLRDNISRLVRRSWCVTQSIEMLQNHLDIYMKFHNTRLI